MTDSSSWWAKKLGRAPEGPRSPSPGPVTTYAPGTTNTTAASATVTYSTPTGAQAQMWQAQQEQGPPQVMVEDPNAPGGKRMNWRAWAGGQANREETARCPNCGSANFFSRKQNAMITQNGTAYPAPQCAECSFNGRFTIFGS